VSWTPEQLEQLAVLVRNAIGFEPARGDVVSVVNSPFVATVSDELGTSAEQPLWQQRWLLDLAKQGVGLLVVLILLLAVLRPVMKSLSQSARETPPAELPLGDLAATGLTAEAMDALGGDKVTLSGGDGMMLPGPDNSYEQRLTAIKGMIAEDPGRVAQVVKKWVSSSE
jgi:flagellar M-ring protein FliF